MDTLKLRRLLVNLHLIFAGFMAPAFILIAVTGGLHMVGGGEKVTSKPISLPAGTNIDFKSPTAKQDVEKLLAAAGVDHTFEYIKDRGNTAQTRPNSRPYIDFKKTPDGWTATHKTPNLQKALMEIHKGHGPKILRTYHKIVALILFFVVFGGILVGLLAKNYRGKTILSLAIGSILYIALILFA